MLLDELLACDAHAGWSRADAERWWTDLQSGAAPGAAAAETPTPKPATAPGVGSETVALPPDQHVVSGP